MNNPETPATGILSMYIGKSSKSYQIACQCGCNDHNVTVFISSGDTGVTLSQYVTVSTDSWTTPWLVYYDESWLLYQVKICTNAVVRRVKLLFDIIVFGRVKLESDTVMDKQQAINYAYTILNAVDDVEKYQRARSAQISAKKEVKE